MSATHTYRSLRAVLSALLLFVFCSGFLIAGHADIPAVPTQNNDNARTGANLNETILTPANVSVAKFGKLFTRTLDANVNGQVLYVPNLTINGSSHNVIFAYTSNNSNNSPCSLYAYDADDPAASTALWRHQFTNSAQWTTCTPVIDTTNNIIYVLTKDNTDSGVTRLRALDLLTGNEKTGSPVTIAATVKGTGDGSSGGNVTFNTAQANCRPGLLLLNGVVYFAFAHNSDSFPYHGWVFGYSYNGTQFTQTAVFNTCPNGGLSGIWQAGKGLTADNAGNIYFSIGNGTFDANSGGTSYGMCYMKLGTPNLNVLDWFAPHDEQSLSNSDLDLGNSGLVGIPGTTRLFGGATKFGSVFLLDSTNMGGFTPNGPDKVVQRLDNISNDDNVGQNPIAWDAGTTKYVYLWPNGYNLQQFKYDTMLNELNPAGIWKEATVTNGGSLAISANGSTNGILWAVGNDGVVHAFDATDLSKTELWNSSQNSTRDKLGSVGHFQFLTVVNGKLYVPSGSKSIVVYGLQSTQSGAISGLFNTGLSSSGTVASDSSVDVHWQLTKTPAGASGTAYVTQQKYPIQSGTWLLDTSTSKWISPQANEGATPEDAVGSYTYQTTFTVTGDPTTVKISGQVASDNQITAVILNGVTVVSNLPSSYNGWTSLSLSSGFVSGTNTLQFVVNNTGAKPNPSGFRAELTGGN